MPSLVAIRHVSFEDLDGFAPAFEARGYKVSYREAPVDDLGASDLAQCDLLVVLGGPAMLIGTETQVHIAAAHTNSLAGTSISPPASLAATPIEERACA